MASLNYCWLLQRVAESKWARTLLANRTTLLSKYWPSTLILLLALAWLLVALAGTTVCELLAAAPQPLSEQSDVVGAKGRCHRH